ncbi:hypothetical protein EVAR_101998_1 [Eumeta japonica]|uniref:Uncharacterized protein n=1 Tax=Eumeta variegata TaxID=151549 RepID=A0A4C1TSV5_EUMVA|nr:hypothetical protein EVAR_101998_1 [Eumeta japonica]
MKTGPRRRDWGDKGTKLANEKFRRPKIMETCLRRRTSYLRELLLLTLNRDLDPSLFMLRQFLKRRLNPLRIHSFVALDNGFVAVWAEIMDSMDFLLVYSARASHVAAVVQLRRMHQNSCNL